MTAVAQGVVVAATLTRSEARALTDRVKLDAHALADKMLALREGEAHTALGYSSWAAYVKEEFGQSDATAYRTLQFARLMRELPTGSPRPSERVARELRRAEPDRRGDVWREVTEQHGPTPTAAQTREAVEARREPEPEPREGPIPDRWDVGVQMIGTLATSAQAISSHDWPAAVAVARANGKERELAQVHKALTDHVEAIDKAARWIWRSIENGSTVEPYTAPCGKDGHREAWRLRPAGVWVCETCHSSRAHQPEAIEWHSEPRRVA